MRATIRDGELTLVPGRLATVSGGPIGCLARAALPPGACVADLRFGAESEDAADESDEADGGDVLDEADDADDGGDAEVEDRTVEVRFLANDGADARRELKRWAARTGHERIWFRDEVCELEPPAAIDREHSTTCPSCGLEITDSGPELMGFVRKAGHFPLNCFVCGTFVPQWRPRSDSYGSDDSLDYGEQVAHPGLHVVGGRECGDR